MALNFDTMTTTGNDWYITSDEDCFVWSDGGNATTSGICTDSATTTDWTTAWIPSKKGKQVLRCSDCGKKIATFYGHEYIQKDIKCKTCHQIEKLRE